MKKDGPAHPKLKRLQRLLGITKPHAVGLMELLWHYVADYAPTGNIGRFDDVDIADAAGWDGDSEQFVNALINCGQNGAGYLERHPDHRLIIHDWEDHCPAYIRKRLIRQGLEFVQSMTSQWLVTDHTLTSQDCPPVPTNVPTGGTSNPTKPSLTQPNPTTPNPTIPQPPSAKKVSANRRREITAAALLQHFRDTIKTNHYSPPAQTKRNIIAKLKGDYDHQQLRQTIANYAESIEILDKGPQYVVSASNFFGRKAVFEAFTESNYDRPEPPTDGQGSNRPTEATTAAEHAERF